MKKREKRLELSKETLRSLISPLEARNLVEVLGGSCTSGASTAGGSAKVCCIDNSGFGV